MKKTNFPATAGSRKMREKSALTFFLVIFVIGSAFISLAGAEELTQQAKITPPVQESKDSTSPVRNTELEGLNKISNGTRIIVTTSGPAKFSSHWLDYPHRLVVEFQTENIVSSIGSELAVNEGVIKRITSEYYGNTQKNLKSLTFELLEKVPYTIWQEDNNIILDIQASLAAPLGSDGKEVFVKDESKGQIGRRLETMETALKQLPVVQVQAEPLKLIAKTSPPQRKTTAPSAFWLIGLILISSVGLLAWLFWRRYKLILDKNLAACEIAKLKMQLQEQNQLLEHEQIIRKTVESTSLQREKEFDQLKTESQKEQQLLEQEQKARKTAEDGLSQKEKESEQVKNSLESLKEVLVNKGLAKKISSPEGEGELWIPEKSSEKRQLLRLDLSRDYNRTIILRIESPDKSKSIKSFANNIGLGGLCFETRRDFEEKEAINLRLFFFGDNVPILKIKAEIIWKKAGSPVNHYGVSFVSLEDKNKANLSQYIESKILSARI
ncbi:MAG: PilZ domain-containing protein [Candidatus Omnitrophota bacterium]